jgi:phage baseplate assembly protein V
MHARSPDLLDVVELARRLTNLLRLGTVAHVDHAAARVRVQSGELLTDWLPWLTHRAGATATWCPPSVGEQVLLLCPSGDLAAAVALPAVYADAHPAPSTSPAEHVTLYPDGARLAYNHSTGALTATGIQTATVQAAASVTLDTPITTLTGQLIVQGLLTYQAGLAGTGGDTGTTISGPITQTGGILSSNGIALATHTHTGVRSGGDNTGAPA